MEKHKVLMITPTLAGGGAERVLLNLAEGLDQLGDEIHIVVIKNQLDYDVASHLHLHVVDLPPVVTKHKVLQTIYLRFFFRRLLRQHGPFDLILSNYQSRADFLPASAREKLFFWIHSDYWSDIAAILHSSPRKAKRQMRRITDFFNNRNLIAVSEGAKQSLLAKNKVIPNRMHVIYNPLDFDKIREQAEQSLPGIPDEPFIVHAARFEPNKRHDLLLEAFSELRSPVKLVLLTKHDPRLEELIDHYGLQERVLVAGFQKNPFPWMKRARLCVLASDSGEALGMVLIESLICGTPVVSTDCPYGPNEVLTGPLAHWLVPVNDAQALRDKIEEALESHISIDEDVIKKFHRDVVLQQYMDLIK